MLHHKFISNKFQPQNKMQKFILLDQNINKYISIMFPIIDSIETGMEDIIFN